jgi:hypothetical protein
MTTVRRSSSNPIVAALIAIAAAYPAAQAVAQGTPPMAAALTPEQRWARRFPQPVAVGDLLGLRILDYDDVTIAYVRKVVRTTAGKILLIAERPGFLGFGGRLVAVPIEVVAIFGRQLASLDMPPEEYDRAPTWNAEGSVALPADAKVLVALTKR